MFKLDGSDIYLTRGDSMYLMVTLTDSDGVDFLPEEGSVMRFAMKKRIKATELLILKPIPIDTMTLELEPEDTKNLRFGQYVYDIEYTDAQGRVSTVVLGDFYITDEVY